jgi:hypothetical protein
MAFIVGYLGMGVLLIVILWSLYSLRENAIHTRREEIREEAVEEFRRELDERGVALFEIPEAEEGHRD